VGCGTGSLVVLVERLHPEVEIVGLDPDPKALARARKKAKRAGVPARFDQGFSDALTYPAASFDHVFSSFMFHHLEQDQKLETLREVARVLKPGGHLHLLDFVGPRDVDSRLSRWFHKHHRLTANEESKVLELMKQAGFANARTIGHRALLFGLAHAAYYQASAPGSNGNTVGIVPWRPAR
jgi:ubiquinone/menaquinone biosynthesis C-methylase UbiE